ncbi:MAG: A/G-specific adenine glycosylase [Bacteroides sp.]|jgi:A/G-specific adenine glycosylase|nr:A/G-specific adenine glycosylase [Bacteroides sp.]MCI1683273.1 A/G-specific adenine glycosylase [Bacteroides sp.]
MSVFSNSLIKWYALNRRDLPWRDTRDPYIIWISEVILQQTRVEQGYDYFLRFIRRFPDVTALASASEDEVLKHWQGLGYYSRARNLHEAAKSMKGCFPNTYEGVRALKGVGDYTAAAICSIAYGMPYAVVDGNVYRVLSRYFGVDIPIDTTEGKKTFAALAQEMLDTSRPDIYNQAIMDFGAMQCTPKTPNCLFCPIADICFALRKGMVDRLPVKTHKTKVVNRYFNYMYVCMGEYTFLHKRTLNDIWKNLYEFPLVETDVPVTEDEFAALPEVRALFAEGEEPVFSPIAMGVKHVLSHRTIYANFYEVILPESSSSFSSFLRVKSSDLEQYAVSRLIHGFMEKYL